MGNGVSRSGGSERRHFVVGADVRFCRSVEIEIGRMGPAGHERAQVLDRKHLAGKEDEAQLRGIVLLELTELDQHAQDGWGRIPDRDAEVGDQGRKGAGLFAAAADPIRTTDAPCLMGT